MYNNRNFYNLKFSTLMQLQFWIVSVLTYGIPYCLELEETNECAVCKIE